MLTVSIFLWVLVGFCMTAPIKNRKFNQLKEKSIAFYMLTIAFFPVTLAVTFLLDLLNILQDD